MEPSKHQVIRRNVSQKQKTTARKQDHRLNVIVGILSVAAGVGIAISVPLDFDRAFDSCGRQSEDRERVSLITHIRKICGWSSHAGNREIAHRRESYLINQRSGY